MKKLAILGSTGSIGQQTLEVVRAFPERFKVVALACGKNTSLLREQIEEFKPHIVNINSEKVSAKEFDVRLGPLEELASYNAADLVVIGTSGKAGLGATLAAIRAGKTVALANKEVLVMAGEIVMTEALKYRTEIIPVDSEHSAIRQCLRGEGDRTIKRIILTASGGPFSSWETERLAEVTPEEALNHPTWQMGVKVTIDSATLMNKGMEIIEAHWLFHVPYSKIEVVIHPQSVIHSMVEFIDGSTKAQLSMPDMRLPIQYALTYPERWEGPFRQEMDYSKLGSLDFKGEDTERFPCLKLARQAGEDGGTYPAVLSAADEVAVELFMEKKIALTDIAVLVANALDGHSSISNPSIDDILEADAWARNWVRQDSRVTE